MRERGSVLMLMPAAVLVFVVLGALAVDAGLAFLGEREVSDAAAAAANDAASQALDRDAFYARTAVRLDPLEADRVARATVSRAGLDDLRDVVVTVAVEPGSPTVTVVVRARARYLFSAALPGGHDSIAVSASSTATAREDRR